MAKHGRGLICLALTKKQVDNLKLPQCLPSINQECKPLSQFLLRQLKVLQPVFQHKTEQKQLKLQSIQSKKSEIVSPGHVFPLVARNGGVWKEQAILRHL